MLYQTSEWNDVLSDAFVRLTLKAGLPVKSLEKNKEELAVVLSAAMLALHEAGADSPRRAEEVVSGLFSGGVLSWMSSDETTSARILDLLEEGGFIKRRGDSLEMCAVYVKPGHTLSRLADEMEAAAEILKRRRQTARDELQARNRALNSRTTAAPPREVDEAFMMLALAEAEKAYEADEVPVGAVLVKDGVVIASGSNLTIRNSDPTAHAEVVAIRLGAERIENHRLVGSTLYVTLEPCPMCAGAVCESRIERVVYGAGDARKGAFGGAFNLSSFAGINHRPVVESGVLAEEARSLLVKFFEKKR